jgi:hypothetical protein
MIKDLPQLRVLIPPQGVKDLSEAHLLGLGVSGLVETLKAEVASAWEAVEEEPEPETPLALPVDDLPAPLAWLASEARSRDGFAPELVAVPSLSALGALVGGNYELRLNEGWLRRAIVWTVVLAGSGAKKSPAIDRLVHPIAQCERELVEKAKQQLLNQTRPILRVSDITMEALYRRLERQEHGILWMVDELAGLIRSLGQYKMGKGSDRQKLLELWAGGASPYDRVRDNLHLSIPRPTVSIGGGLQPEVLNVLDGGDGLRARFLISKPDIPIVPARLCPGTSQAALDSVQGFFRQLVRNRPVEITTIDLADDARELWFEMRDGYETEGRRESWEVAAKMPGHVAAIALALHVGVHVANGEVVPRRLDRSTLEAAGRWGDYFLSQSRRLRQVGVNLMASLAERNQDEAVDRLDAWLLGQPDNSATRREIQRARVAGCRTAKDVDAMLRRYGETYPGSVVDEVPGHATSGLRVARKNRQ